MRIKEKECSKENICRATVVKQVFYILRTYVHNIVVQAFVDQGCMDSIRYRHRGIIVRARAVCEGKCELGHVLWGVLLKITLTG